MRLAIAVAGALSIYFGYRLFCLPGRANRGVLFFKTISGAVLALLGMAILTADLRSLLPGPLVTQTPKTQEVRPADQGIYTPSGRSSSRKSADWLV